MSSLTRDYSPIDGYTVNCVAIIASIKAALAAAFDFAVGDRMSTLAPIP